MLVTLIRNRDARQAGAIIEGINTDGGDAITNCDARQAVTVSEGRIPLPRNLYQSFIPLPPKKLLWNYYSFIIIIYN